ncbi:MAG TPA: DUF5320 domain-containing protein [Syntrophorhabdaceae bacterium]|nr:DUF5320 domain-containing protein [Syntrophorhabdaceae bacterium]
MPRGDGTGPMGMGPGTGRAGGYCAGFSMPGYMNPVPGRRFLVRPWGFAGRGRGYRHWFYATGLPFWARFNPNMYGQQPLYGQYSGYSPQITKEMEIDFLKREAEDLENALKEIKDRLEKLAEEK